MFYFKLKHESKSRFPIPVFWGFSLYCTCFRDMRTHETAPGTRSMMDPKNKIFLEIFKLEIMTPRKPLTHGKTIII